MYKVSMNLERGCPGNQGNGVFYQSQLYPGFTATDELAYTHTVHMRTPEGEITIQPCSPSFGDSAIRILKKILFW